MPPSPQPSGRNRSPPVIEFSKTRRIIRAVTGVFHVRASCQCLCSSTAYDPLAVPLFVSTSTQTFAAGGLGSATFTLPPKVSDFFLSSTLSEPLPSSDPYQMRSALGVRAVIEKLHVEFDCLPGARLANHDHRNGIRPDLLPAQLVHLVLVRLRGDESKRGE